MSCCNLTATELTHRVSRPVSSTALCTPQTRLEHPLTAGATVRSITHCLILCALFTTCWAADDTDTTDAHILSAARAANLHYQHKRSNLINQLKSEDLKRRVAAIDLLGRLQEPAIIPFLVPYLDYNLHPEAVVTASCRALARLGAQSVSEELSKVSRHGSTKSMRASAWNALAQLKQLSNVHFTDQSNELDNAIRGSGITNLGTIKEGEAGAILVRALLHDKRRHVRRMAAIGLGKLGNTAFGNDLITALSDGDAKVRRYASSSLAKLEYKAAIPYLLIHLEANVGGKYLNEALIILSGQDFGYHYTDTLTARRDAIQRGFVWYTNNSKNF